VEKEKTNTDLDCESNAIDWTRQALTSYFGEVLEFRDSALDSDDMEGVHKMRVAIRRLRSAFRGFSPLLNSHFLNEFKKELKRFADTLGKARDEDVAIAALEKLRKKAKNERIKINLGKKIEKRRLKREKTQIQLTETLKESSLEILRKHFDKAINEAGKHSQKTSLTAKEAGCEIISKEIKDFCDLSPSLYNPFNREKLHELRIASKRLRYAIELFSVCWGDKIVRFAREITDMQTFLGELHDRDIWIEKLSRRLNKKHDNKRSADLWLLSRFSKERTKNYRAALRLWSKWQKNKFVKKLQAVLENS
jgi:CHAD domain-containing protein